MTARIVELQELMVHMCCQAMSNVCCARLRGNRPPALLSLMSEKTTADSSGWLCHEMTAAMTMSASNEFTRECSVTSIRCQSLLVMSGVITSVVGNRQQSRYAQAFGQRSLSPRAVHTPRLCVDIYVMFFPSSTSSGGGWSAGWDRAEGGQTVP